MRLSLFGGTFDPIHNAHLTVAREAADRFNLEQVWFIPAAHPPHKAGQAAASFEDRYRMVQEAAYFIAEKDAFSGCSTDYWIAAEAQIEAIVSGK